MLYIHICNVRKKGLSFLQLLSDHNILLTILGSDS